MGSEKEPDSFDQIICKKKKLWPSKKQKASKIE